MNDRQALLDRRAALREEYGAFFDKLAALLFELDPMGLDYGDNVDEYEPEAGTILPRLAAAGSVEDVAVIVHEEFTRWFGRAEVGPPEDYFSIAEKIWQAWSESLNRHPPPEAP